MLTLLMLLVPARAAPACLADDVCDPSEDPCVIDDDWEITDGCTLDFGARDVHLLSRGRLDAGVGTAELLAGAMTVDGGELRGRDGGSMTLWVTGDLILDGAVNFDSNDAAGHFEAHAGFIWSLARINASSRAADTDGGSVLLDGTGGVILDTAVDCPGGRTASGGSIEVLSSGAIVVGSDLDASGGEWDGGTIELRTRGPVTLAGTTSVSGAATGSGGSIVVVSSGPMNVDATLRANGGDGGYGGTIFVRSRTSNVLIAGSAQAQGSGLDGDAGSIVLRADRNLYVDATLEVDAPGRESAAGTVVLLANGTTSTRANISASGGSYGGGSIGVYGRQRVEVLANLTADGGGSDGNGGDIMVKGARLWMDGATLRAKGPAAGSGGTILLEACDADLTSSTSLDARPAGGSNEVIVHGTLEIEGDLQAGDSNTLVYRGTAPVVDPAASFTPAAVVVPDPALAQCPV